MIDIDLFPARGNPEPSLPRPAVQAIAEENERLHRIGAAYSGARELAARSLILSMQAALMSWRLSGSTHALDDVESRMAEFMRGAASEASAESARWSAHLGICYGPGGEPIRCAVISDGDFANEAKLQVSGGFETLAAQLRYAQELADSLNRKD